MKNLFLTLILVLLPGYILAQAEQFRGTNRDGIYPDKDLLDQWPAEGPELIAEINGLGDGYGSPSFNEEGMYIAGSHEGNGSVYHFDHEYKLQWKVEYGNDFTYKYLGARATPTLEEDRLYYVGTYGNVLCLNNVSGQIIWEKDLFSEFRADTIKWGYTESPLIYRDLVIFTPGGPGHNVVALDKMTGELRWAMDMEDCKNAYNSPVLIQHNGEDMIMMNTTSHFLMFHPLNGKVAYSHRIDHRSNMHAISPLYLDGRILYTSGYGEGSVMYGINEESHGLDTIWYNPDLDCKLSGLITVEGTVFGTGDKKKRWVGVDLQSGSTVYTSRELKPGSFLMADNKFIIFTETGEVALVNPSGKGLEIISRFHIPVSPVQMAFGHPVLYDGKLHVRFKDQLWVYRIVDR